MARSTQIKVTCKCGYQLFEYDKRGHGRLIKCFLSRILVDNVGVIDLPIGIRPLCPNCGKTLGEIRFVSGKPALKLNQGTIKKTTT